MNCSYRIAKTPVYIGLRVRKTNGPFCVSFDNKPFSGAIIEKYTSDGFQISHPSIPKAFWLDFEQLPLNKITLINGVIQDELTFVERLVSAGTTSMVLIQTQTMDYLELLADKQFKDERPKYSVKDLIPGEEVISCLCREGTKMIYLGTFKQYCFGKYYGYGYYYYRDAKNKKIFGYLQASPMRAIFLVGG